MKKIITGFDKKKVLLVGDTILDIYVYGTAIGKSLETPTIVAKENSKKLSFGGASLVARNLAELGANVDFVSVIGNDESAKYYDSFSHPKIKKFFVVDKSRQTTVKKRFWIDGYKLLQMDNLDNRDIDDKISAQLLEEVKNKIKQADLVVISDYRHGLFTTKIIEELKELAKANEKNMVVDSQISHRESMHHFYRDSYLVLLSEKEAKQLDEKFVPTKSKDSFEGLKKVLGNSNICVKLGEKGSIALINGQCFLTKAIDVEPKDTCGAGDAFIAALSLSGLENPVESLCIANAWAGLSTTIHGTEPPKKQELLKQLGKGRF